MDSTELKLLTGEDLAEVVAEHPDRRFELIAGRLIEMAPTGLQHGSTENRIAAVLNQYSQGRGTVLVGEVGFYTRQNDQTVRAADVAFISYKRMPMGQVPAGYGTIAPELIVEVVSPNDRAADIESKVQEWLDFGAMMVWVVYPQTQRLHVYLADEQPRILAQTDTLDGGTALPEFSIALSEIFPA
ncbi:MAG: Uma2 family endonuclease [Anaerolineaceae bacterium]|nr:Uma2 family endonuclease [Anaerolineaceae bacterium]